jgi:hypothetical protein
VSASPIFCNRVVAQLAASVASDTSNTRVVTLVTAHFEALIYEILLLTKIRV